MPSRKKPPTMLYGSRTRLLNTDTEVALAATLMATGTRNLNAALKERNIFCTLSSME
jgi:hypothetical protein